MFICIIQSSVSPHTEYQLKNQIFLIFTKACDLWVIYDLGLLFDEHIDEIVKKA